MVRTNKKDCESLVEQVDGYRCVLDKYLGEDEGSAASDFHAAAAELYRSDTLTSIARISSLTPCSESQRTQQDSRHSQVHVSTKVDASYHQGCV